MTRARLPRRADIDGLRAIAVIAVVVFHAVPQALPGGFAGVDVFFVISGFLITRIVVDALGADTFSFADFYARRVRRIVPALLTVLAACMVAGWFLLLADEYSELGNHVAGGAGFVSNLVLWNEVGYFDADAATKPLLHLWSLGIEEQFYLVWPLLLWLGWRLRRSAFAITLGVLALSFALQLVSHGAAAFYAPQARVWELMIGAVLAQRPPAPRGDAMCGLGLAAIATSFALGSPLISTLGTGLAISAGGDTWLARRVLARPPAVWLGRISYPLYLWHWPILAFLRILDGEAPSALQTAIAVGASLALAAGTHRFIEVPIQRGPARRTRLLGLCAGLLLVGSAGFDVFVHDGFPARAIDVAAPRLRPFPSTASCYAAYPFASGGCYDSPDAHPETLLLVGDSHAEALAPGLVDATLETNLRIITRVGCMPFLHVEFVDANGDRPRQCRAVVERALDSALSDRRVTTVVLVGRHAVRAAPDPSGHFELDDGTRDAAVVFQRGLADTVTALQSRGIRVVFVDQVPELAVDPRACIPRPFGLGRHTEGSCGVPLAAVVERQRPYRALVDRVLPPGVVRVDPLSVFCRAGVCDAWREGLMLYVDRDHLSPFGAHLLATEIAARLR